MERLEARARARGERAAADAASRLGEDVREAFPELTVDVEPEPVVVRGAGLGRRMLAEPGLRWLGGLLR
ncbi:hypothetical protein [Sphingomonas xinjiangensis]|uniref:Uncharacterized protein n=1 Tax=Sphingomonas xinjiangensis TaxID=643568 RepID=A0A840YQX1_9SPHN|nr:hypothetical protein [Sphingomonas xinjiangensis]MBB5711452.1 hypothetical protein [Sphingomonas xinjiangensis]